VTRPPNDDAAERAVLGAALLAPQVIADLAATLAPGDFYRPAHARLWSVLLDLDRAAEVIDPITVAAHLTDTGDLARVGGAPYLHTLIADVPSAANATHYAGIVTEHARRRTVVEFATRFTQAASSGANTASLLAMGRGLLDAGLEWPAPVPLTGRHTPAPFPLDALPGWVRAMVAAVAHFTQTPVDLAGCLALAVLATAAGGRVEVEVRGSWREPVNLFIVIALPPGSRKSPTFAALVRPLLIAERLLIEQATPAIVEAELAIRVAQREADKAAQLAAATDGPGRDTALAEATGAAMTAAAITVPHRPRLIADDITSEQAASILAENGGRLAVLSAEGGIFATLAGRYSGTPNLDVFLKGHAGDMLRVDRRSREAEHVDKPALTLGLCVQPEVLRDIAGMPGFRGRGLLGRLLYSVPVNTVGSRLIGADAIPDDVAADYSTRLQQLVVDLNEWTDPAILVLSPDANRRVMDLEREIEPQLAPGAQLSHVVDWAAKYVGAVVRIAGLLHLGDHGTTGLHRPIDVATIDRAARIGAYFLAHALVAFDDMGADPLIDDATHVLAWLARTRPTRITRRDLFTAVRSTRFRKVADLDPVLNLLTAHGYLAPEPAPERATGRPPSPAWLVHPDLHRPATLVQPITAAATG
jgi:replicative DNA helicase